MGRRPNVKPAIAGNDPHVNSNDLVYTPDWLARKICSMFPVSGKVLEPCRGTGAFMPYLPSDADWCEIADGRNFYDYHQSVDWIVTNPPYSDFDRFFEHSLVVSDNIVFLVPIGKMFKSMGTLRRILGWGGFVEVHALTSSLIGFPFGFPSAVYWLKRGYTGDTRFALLDVSSKDQEVSK